MSPEIADDIRATVDEQVGPYANEHRPLGAYAGLSVGFFAAFAAALAALEASGRPIPERPPTRDIVLGALATQKVSRLIAKDRVTSFIRAPFTRYQEGAGHGELSEEARGTGLRLALGELLICPYCLAQWVAGGLTVGYVAAPRTTRLLTAMWSAQAIADFVQLGYSAAEGQT